MGDLEAKDEEAVKGLKDTKGRERTATKYLQDTGRGAECLPKGSRGNLGTPGAA